MKNRSWFTLVELVVSAIILVIVVIMFWVIFKQVIMFIDYSKQQFSMLNEVISIRQEIWNVLANKKIRLLRKEVCSESGAIIDTSYWKTTCDYIWKNVYSQSWVYSVKDTVLVFPNPMSKDILIFQDTNPNSQDIYMMWIIDKKTKTLMYDDNDDNWLFWIARLKPENNSMSWVYWQSFQESCDTNKQKAKDNDYCNYFNTNLNILWFRHTIINSWAFLRIDIDYDNNIMDEIKAKDNKEFYYSGSIHMIKKLD